MSRYLATPLEYSMNGDRQVDGLVEADDVRNLGGGQGSFDPVPVPHHARPERSVLRERFLQREAAMRPIRAVGFRGSGGARPSQRLALPPTLLLGCSLRLLEVMRNRLEHPGGVVPQRLDVHGLPREGMRPGELLEVL
jgi:hypothetical protein